MRLVWRLAPGRSYPSTRLASAELMVIQQNMSFVSEGYTSLGGRLKSEAAQLSSLLEGVKETQKEADLMVAWLGDMKHKAASGNSAAGEKGSVKAQLEQQKVGGGRWDVVGRASPSKPDL